MSRHPDDPPLWFRAIVLAALIAVYVAIVWAGTLTRLT